MCLILRRVPPGILAQQRVALWTISPVFFPFELVCQCASWDNQATERWKETRQRGWKPSGMNVLALSRVREVPLLPRTTASCHDPQFALVVAVLVYGKASDLQKGLPERSDKVFTNEESL